MNWAATDERSIDHALARWVRERSGSELLARAAFATSLAEGQGHACAALVEEPGLSAADIAVLREHAWVGDSGHFTPFVLDADANFYTWRNWQHETRLVMGLRRRAEVRASPIAGDALAADVAELFAGEDLESTRLQRAAVVTALGLRVFVLTGGPGTGKTTTVLRMLLELLRRGPASGLPAQPAVALAAPTGKAAQRLAQAIAQDKQRLLGKLASGSAFRALFERIPHAQAQTLHRLLGFRPRENTFARGVGNPLAADIVVVDEASMVDLAMMRQLVDALRPDAILILLGDPAQLAAVEAGSVLGDIVASVSENATSAMAGKVVTLMHGWRAGSGLQRGLDALRVGDTAWLDAFLASGKDGALALRACVDAASLRTRIDAWIDRRAAWFEELRAPGIAPQAALESLRDAQILCALRDSAFGAQGVNARMARRLGERFRFDATQTWHPGRPVIITRNDYARDLYNGDVGIALQGAEGLRVWFQVGTHDGSVGLRSFSPRALPAHETAWAITIHRSQGSEYANVAVVLPPDADHRILSRELLYTAVSRATESAEIWTSAPALRTSATRPLLRRGGLRARL